MRISSLAGQLSTPEGRSLVSEGSTVGAGTKRTLEEEGRRGDLPMACWWSGLNGRNLAGAVSR